MFPCKYCPERFAARGLTQHHRKCQAFLKHEAKAYKRRKTTVASNKARRTKLRVKLDDRKARLGSGAPGVSLTLPNLPFFLDSYSSHHGSPVFDTMSLLPSLWSPLSNDDRFFPSQSSFFFLDSESDSSHHGSSVFDTSTLVCTSVHFSCPHLYFIR